MTEEQVRMIVRDEIARAGGRRTGEGVLFITHSLDTAQDMGRRIRALAERAGVGPVLGSNRGRRVPLAPCP